MPEPLRWGMILPNGEPLRYGMGPDIKWNGTVPQRFYPTNIMSDPNNKVSFTVTAAEKADLIGHFTAIKAFLADKGPALTAIQRRMQSIAEERAGMLDVFPAEMTNHPQFRPSWVSMPEVTKDVDTLRIVLDIVAE